jgi:hypothetical protein
MHDPEEPPGDSTPLPSVVDTDPPRVEVTPPANDDEEDDVLPISRPPRVRRVLQVAGAMAAVALALVAVRGATSFFKRAPAPAVVAAPPPPPVQEPAAAAPAAAQPSDLVAPEDVATLKKQALASLEKRKVDDAIESAKRATEIDDRDGEAWLLLGASYQEKGRIDLARQCYAACAQKARLDPKGECAALMHSASLDYRSWPVSIPRPKPLVAGKDVPAQAAAPTPRAAKGSPPSKPAAAALDLEALVPKVTGEPASPVAEPARPDAESAKPPQPLVGAATPAAAKPVSAKPTTPSAKPGAEPAKPPAPEKPANAYDSLKID